MNDPWWAAIDFGSDHSIVQSATQPGPNRAPYEGPFRSFTDARRYVLRIGAAEISGLNDKQRWWREASKADILGVDDE